MYNEELIECANGFMFFKSKKLFLIVCFFGLLLVSTADCCSRILMNQDPQHILVARTLDWEEPMGDEVNVYPRGQKSNGEAGHHSAEWISAYGSLLLEGKNYKNGGIEGVNEKGLAAHLLYQGDTTYEAEDARPGVSYLLWARYLLDNFSNVQEAVEGMKKIRIVPVELKEGIMPLHMAIDDASGDSAIFEFIDGHLVVFHGREYRVMTNAPAYNLQLINLKHYAAFGGEIPVPDIAAADRFFKASYHLRQWPAPGNEIEAVDNAFSLISTVLVPSKVRYGMRAPLGTSQTWWSTVIDLTRKKFYYQSMHTWKVVCVDLQELDFSEGALVLEISLEDIS